MGRIDSALITFAERLYYASHRRAHVVDWIATALPRVASAAARDAAPRVLDFGGGDGAVAAALAVRLGTRVVVADVDEAALARVPASSSLRRVRLPSEPPLPFRDAVFAGVVLIDVLHHVPTRDRTLRELVRVLRPGGVVAIVEFEPHRLATRLFRRFARLGGRNCRFETREVLAARLVGLGLAVETVTLDELRYGVVGRRASVTPSSRYSLRR